MIFDTLKDPQESNDLAPSHSGLQAKMKTRVLSMRRTSAPQNIQQLDDARVPAVNIPLSDLKQGLHWRIWNGNFKWVPDFSQMGSPNAVGQTDRINVQPIPLAAQKGVELTGYLLVPQDEEYTFYLKTDHHQGSKAFIHLHDTQMIDKDFNYIPGSEADSKALQGGAADVLARRQANRKTAGRHPIKRAYIGRTASSALSLQWESSAARIKKQNIPTKYFCRDIKRKQPHPSAERKPRAPFQRNTPEHQLSNNPACTRPGAATRLIACSGKQRQLRLLQKDLS